MIKIIIILMLLLVPVQSFAMETGFITNEITEEEYLEYEGNIDISLMLENDTYYVVECFDVNDNGLIAIAGSRFNNKKILIYSSNGEFLYGYEFNIHGDFGIEWDNDNLNMYTFRGEIIFSLDKDANIVEMARISDDYQNEEYSRDNIFSALKQINGITYVSLNSKLTAIDQNGEETVIYEASAFEVIGYQILFWLVFITSLVLVLIKYKAKVNKPLLTRGEFIAILKEQGLQNKVYFDEEHHDSYCVRYRNFKYETLFIYENSEFTTIYHQSESEALNYLLDILLHK